jgi:flagellar motor protein MotB/tetratricopeptide (TPR) repeat protein
VAIIFTNAQIRRYSLKIHLFLFWFLLGASVSGLQAQSIVPPKSEKALRRAESAYAQRDIESMKRHLDEAVETGPRHAEAFLFRADFRVQSGLAAEAIVDFYAAFRIDPKRFSRAIAVAGTLWMDLEKPDSAVACFRLYLEHATLSPEKRVEWESRLSSAQTTAQLMRNPIQLNAFSMGKGINESTAEYHPSFTIDGSKVIFTVRMPYKGGCPGFGAKEEENFFESSWDGNQWLPRKSLPGRVNTPCNEGAGCVSPDGRFLFFAASAQTDNYGSMDLYVSEWKSGAWQQPQNLGPKVNGPHWESQPNFSADGKTLYFVSNRPGGLGKQDIWKTQQLSNGSWANPENLGPPINTAEDDFSPFLHANQHTFYFASKGHPGVGGSDIFRAELQANGKSGSVQNFGYPLNTLRDERLLVVSADGKKGYYASNAPGGQGDFDLYGFDIPANLQPEPVTWLNATVLTEDRIDFAYIDIVHLATGDTVVQTKVGFPGGTCLIPLPTGTDYGLSIQAPGHLFHSEHFRLKATDGGQQQTVQLKKIREGNEVVLKNIFFETDRYDLSALSNSELNRLKKFMLQNPGLRISIEGHTDNRGDKSHNLNLSKKRAEAVAQWLIQNGVAASRIESMGFGDSSPVADNQTEAGRALNRRTAFRIIGL